MNRTTEDAAQMTQALGGPDYAVAYGRVVVAQLIGAGNTQTADAAGVDIDPAMLKKIARKDPVAASMLTMFLPSRWNERMNLLKGQAATTVLASARELDLTLANADSDALEAVRERVEDGSYLSIEWTSEMRGNNVLEVTFRTTAIDNHNGAIPENFYNTETMVFVNMAEHRIISFRQNQVTE
ncbi:MAG: hypothetical protein AB8G16_03755 [Gammaproteobacteria bacterium]